MREDDLWRYQQHSRRLHEYLLDLNAAWNDNAAHEITARYLRPQEEDARDLDRHLAALKQTLTKAKEQMLYIHAEAPEASRLSEQIAELASDFQAEEKTSYEHVELSVQSRARAASFFSLVQQLIEQANASCANTVGGGSAGNEIIAITAEANKINSGASVSTAPTTKSTRTPKQVKGDKLEEDVREAIASHPDLELIYEGAIVKGFDGAYLVKSTGVIRIYDAKNFGSNKKPGYVNEVSAFEHLDDNYEKMVQSINNNSDISSETKTQIIESLFYGNVEFEVIGGEFTRMTSDRMIENITSFSKLDDLRYSKSQ